MIAFEVYRNGRRLCVAGGKDLVVLTTHLTWSRPKPTSTRKPRKSKTVPRGEDLDLRVGGMVSLPDGGSDHPRWLSGPVEVGDEIIIKIIRARRADPYDDHSLYTPEKLEAQQRAYYERMKEKFEKKKQRRKKSPSDEDAV